MTSQLAQLLAPIRSASASLASVNSAAVAEAKDAVKQEEAELEAAAAAVAAAVAAAEAEEAAIEAVADALLTQLGLVASEHTTAGNLQCRKTTGLHCSTALLLLLQYCTTTGLHCTTTAL